MNQHPSNYITGRLALASLGLLAVGLSSAHAQINFTGTYSQNFDGIVPATGQPAENTAFTPTLPTGFAFVEAGSNANTTLRLSNGATSTGDTVLWGATGSTERALGSLASGSLTSIYGAVLVNNTGTTLTSLQFSYTGEQWKDGESTGAVPNTLAFSYGVGNTSITTGTFTTVSALSFTSPRNEGNGLGGADITLDGNLAANQVQFNNITISGFSLAPGQNFVFRWSDINDAGNDDGLGVDNITITAVPEPATVAAGLMALGTLGWSQRRRLRAVGFAARRRTQVLVA